MMSLVGPAGRPVHAWLFAPVVALALYFAPLPAWAVDEFYSRDLYPWIQSGLTAASNLVPVAVLDVLVAVTGLLLIYRLVSLAVTAATYSIRAACWEAVRRLVRAVALLVIAFMLLWGYNYRRVPLEEMLPGGSAAKPTEASLEVAVTQSVALAGRLRPGTGATMPKTFDDLAVVLREPMNAALTVLNRETLARPGRPKVSRVFTPFFTWAGVDGMVNPLALESIVHPDLLPFERPYVLAHEWAHLAGQADEAEASAVGWFACMMGPPALAYSASLYLMTEGAAQLPAAARTRALSKLTPPVRADLEAIRQRMLRRKPEVQKAASDVYDTYLRANRVADGTASYSRALTVILSPPLRDVLRDYKKK